MMDTSVAELKEMFRQYVIGLYQDVPTEVYEGLLLFFCIGAIGLFVIFGWKRGWRKVSGLLLTEYVFLIYCSTVIFRKVDEEIGHNFSPFWSYEAIKNGKENLIAENIMNVVVFVPLGLLLGCAFRSMSWWKLLLIGFGISVLIEVLQYYLKRGFSEFDDVFHNTLGCLIGLIIVSIIKRIWLLPKK